MLVKFLKYFKVLFFFFLIALSILAWQFYLFLNKPLNVATPGSVVLIQSGMSLQKIAKMLEEQGLLTRGKWVVCWIAITGDRAKIKAGEYWVKPGTNLLELIELLKSDRVIQHALTIVPGWNFDQVMQAIHNEPALLHTLNNLSSEEVMVKLGYPAVHPEGRFFPDTYYFPLNTKDVAFLQRAYKRMEEKLNTVWQNRSQTLSLKAPEQVLILASIIEKESNFFGEYQDIAGVYVRRLERNMPLAADPTLIYGEGKNYTGRITAVMLKTPSPYNTYLNVGLPPTPIAMPSLNALLAATHPTSADTLYFVANKEGRGHVFSKTLEEHQTAVAEYRKALNATQIIKVPELLPAEKKAK